MIPKIPLALTLTLGMLFAFFADLIFDLLFSLLGFPALSYRTILFFVIFVGITISLWLFTKIFEFENPIAFGSAIFEVPTSAITIDFSKLYSYGIEIKDHIKEHFLHPSFGFGYLVEFKSGHLLKGKMRLESREENNKMVIKYNIWLSGFFCFLNPRWPLIIEMLGFVIDKGIAIDGIKKPALSYEEKSFLECIKKRPQLPVYD